MKLYIDIREEGLYQKCIELLEGNQNVEVMHIPLDLGDALLETNDGNQAIIYERKCLTDLVASIKDGRYEEQSYRLLNACSVHKHNIIYVVEGVLHQIRNPHERKMIMSSITSLMTFKGFSVMRTFSLADTAEFIVSNVLKIGKDIEKGKTFAFANNMGNLAQSDDGENVVIENTVKPYCHVVKKVKKENVRPENIGEIILCQIPGISGVNAVQIMKQYNGSLCLLIDALKKDSGAFLNMKIEGSSGKTRKLNKNIVENLQKYLIYGGVGNGDELEEKVGDEGDNIDANDA